MGNVKLFRLNSKIGVASYVALIAAGALIVLALALSAVAQTGLGGWMMLALAVAGGGSGIGYFGRRDQPVHYPACRRDSPARARAARRGIRRIAKHCGRSDNVDERRCRR